MKDKGNGELDCLQVFKNNKISKEKTFDYDSKEFIGVMSFDFYDGRLSNQCNHREV